MENIQPAHTLLRFLTVSILCASFSFGSLSFQFSQGYKLQKPTKTFLKRVKLFSQCINKEKSTSLEPDSGPPEDLWLPSEGSQEHVRLYDEFLPLDNANSMREVFMQKFENPREGNSNRFVWDWWHVPDQYTLLRTPAEHYFPPEIYDEFLHSLTSFGQEMLGCSTISPPWISLYVDGCEQRLHTDSWHGPWAYVYSLTDWDARQFSGGETMILSPSTLDYWRTFVPKEGLEEGHFMDTVEPIFNRLTVFDPRFPHGVREVRGTKEPKKGRLVVHGWFTDPTPFIVGGLTEEEATAALNKNLEPVYEQLQSVGRSLGVLTVRIKISGVSGAVQECLLLTNTLVPDPNDFDPADELDTVDHIEQIVYKILSTSKFPKSSTKEDTWITIPFLFE